MELLNSNQYRIVSGGESFVTVHMTYNPDTGKISGNINTLTLDDAKVTFYGFDRDDSVLTVDLNCLPEHGFDTVNFYVFNPFSFLPSVYFSF